MARSFHLSTIAFLSATHLSALLLFPTSSHFSNAFSTAIITLSPKFNCMPYFYMFPSGSCGACPACCSGGHNTSCLTIYLTPLSVSEATSSQPSIVSYLLCSIQNEASSSRRLFILLTCPPPSLAFHYSRFLEPPLDLLHVSLRLHDRVLREPQLPVLLSFPFSSSLSQIKH